MKKHVNRINWDLISRKKDLTLDFILEFHHLLDKEWICSIYGFPSQDSFDSYVLQFFENEQKIEN